jgi:ABC-type sugar transport system substrate-binding protein
MRKLLILGLVLISIATIAFAGGKSEGSSGAAGGARTTANRANANAGESITPKDFPADVLPGIKNIGAVPKKKFKIAFSNGDMGNVWRRTFWEDMEDFAKQYKERFGIEFIAANAGNNTTKQLQDCQSLIAQKPDILIVSPNESGPLNVLVELCAKAKIPLMTVDRGLDKTPGEGAYIATIQIDGYRSGIANGAGLVAALTKKYGKAKGRVAEIPGILGSSPAITLSQGIRRVLKAYPDIKMVTVRPGEYDRQKSFKAAQDILTVNPKGTLDAILCASEDAAMAALEAIKSAGRDELLGWIFSVDASIEVLDACLKGDIAQVSEEPPYFGMITFEYAIQYLNGESVPAIIPLPQRSFFANTPESKAKLADVIKMGKDMKITFAPAAAGGFDIFAISKEMREKFYPKPYWDQPASYLKEIEPYTEWK